MKRILVCLLILFGFVLAGCEKEVVREYPARGPRRERGYREREDRERGYRLRDDTTRSGTTSQIEVAVEP